VSAWRCSWCGKDTTGDPQAPAQCEHCETLRGAKSPNEGKAWSVPSPAHFPPPKKEPGYVWLQRAELPAMTRARVKAKPSRRRVVLSDFHYPFADPRAEAIALQVIEATRPMQVILNGDVFDLFSLSRFDKDRRAGKYATLADEMAPAHRFLRQLGEIVSGFDGEIVVLAGNHEDRWMKYLNKNVPELAEHPDAEKLWDFRQWFYPDARVCPLTFADEVAVAGRLRVTHGERVRGQPGQSVRAMCEALGSDVWMGHTHRLGLWPHRIPGFDGGPDTIRKGVEGGCMAVQMDYARLADWHPGFGIIHETADNWQPELIHLENGRAIVPSLNAEIVA